MEKVTFMEELSTTAPDLADFRLSERQHQPISPVFLNKQPHVGHEQKHNKYSR